MASCDVASNICEALPALEPPRVARRERVTHLLDLVVIVLVVLVEPVH